MKEHGGGERYREQNGLNLKFRTCSLSSIWNEDRTKSVYLTSSLYIQASLNTILKTGQHHPAFRRIPLRFVAV